MSNTCRTRNYKRTFFHFLYTVIHIYLTATFYLFFVQIAMSCVFTFRLDSVLYFTENKEKLQSQNLPSNLLLIAKLKEWY